MIYFLLCFVPVFVLIGRFFFRLSSISSALLYLFIAFGLILSIGCNGNDVIFRYLPWIERLSINPEAFDRWGQFEVVIGLSIRYLTVLVSGLDSCLYLTLLRLIVLAIVPFLLCCFFPSVVSVPYFLSVLTACYLSVPFVLALSNAIFQGFALIFMIYFLCFYENLLSREGYFRPKVKLISVALCALSLVLMTLTHSSGVFAAIIVLLAVFVPVDTLSIINLTRFSWRSLRISRRSLLTFLFLLLLSLSIVTLGIGFITSKRVDSSSLFYFISSLSSYILFCRNASVNYMIKFSKYLQFISFLLTLFLLFQGLLLYFGTPSERIGMYFSVCLIASCFSVITSIAKSGSKIPLAVYMPLVPVAFLFLTFPFLPSFSNLAVA